MKVDGIAGSKTVSKLRAATIKYKPGTGSKAGTTKKYTTPHSHRGLSSNDLKLMSNEVYGEGRGKRIK
jgi:hypothetical protein